MRGMIACLIVLSVSMVDMRTNARAQGTTFTVVPEFHEVQSGRYVFQAFVVNKKDNVIWHCSVQIIVSSTTFRGQCGRVAKTSALHITPTTEIASVGRGLGSAVWPALWFIEPATGELHFCTLTTAPVDRCIKLPPLP